MPIFTLSFVVFGKGLFFAFPFKSCVEPGLAAGHWIDRRGTARGGSPPDGSWIGTASRTHSAVCQFPSSVCEHHEWKSLGWEESPPGSAEEQIGSQAVTVPDASPAGWLSCSRWWWHWCAGRSPGCRSPLARSTISEEISWHCLTFCGCFPCCPFCGHPSSSLHLHTANDAALNMCSHSAFLLTLQKVPAVTK